MQRIDDTAGQQDKEAPLASRSPGDTHGTAPETPGQAEKSGTVFHTCPIGASVFERPPRHRGEQGLDGAAGGTPPFPPPDSSGRRS